jgi:hypothetical protein
MQLPDHDDMRKHFMQKADVYRYGLTLNGITILFNTFVTKFEALTFGATTKQPKYMKVVK